MYFLINKYIVSKFDINFNFTSPDLVSAMNLFHRFYIKLHENNDFILVNSRQIKNKCILMPLEDYFIVSPCTSLLEHD